ncbi:hypothetical protein [Herbaspirillum sp. NPDC101397]|uniref:hypothetical protein n=1 Tax=Herbaspirillum sp. NPDC101397 TaxID=3364006 RepID=UPI00383B83E5
MNAGICFTKIWSDDDLLELRIEINEGRSRFQTEVYAGHEQLGQLVLALEVFKGEAPGTQYDLRFGEFDPQFAAGACHFLLKFNARGVLIITAHLQSQFFDFDGKKVANEGKLHLRSHPAQLDDFLRGLAAIHNQHSDTAVLNIE